MTASAFMAPLPTRWGSPPGAARLDSLPPVPRPRRRNPWTSTGEVLIWVLFALLLFPIGFAGWAVGHYTSLGKSASVRRSRSAGRRLPRRRPPRRRRPAPRRRRGRRPRREAATRPPGKRCSPRTAAPRATRSSRRTRQARSARIRQGACFRREGRSQHGPRGIHQGIDRNPDAYIAKGFNKGLMPTTFGNSLSKTQLNDLVAFILSGTKS